MSKIRNFFRFIRLRLNNIHQYDSTATYYFLLTAFTISTIISIYTAIGSPSAIALHKRLLDIMLAIGINSMTFVLFTTIAAIILTFLYVPVARITTSATIYVGLLFTIVFEKAGSGLNFSIILGLLSISATICISLTLYLLWQKKAGIIISLLLIASLLIFINVQDRLPFTNMALEQNERNVPLLQGNHSYDFLTYGNGTDKHRKEFAIDTDILTPTVDASHFITKWGDKRASFWGFTPDTFPINGRVWMPEGEGPFPIVLMVHGNHTMEYLSTAGYDYLGELLASQGFFFVSVDEDFVNYSNITGQPNDNYELRAWFLLQHLIQLKEMSEEVGHLFYEKLDFNHIALGGHSRGGQAAAMAADYMTFFADEEEMLRHLLPMNIEAVFALSPTDRSINNKYAQLHQTSYLTLHGSHDTDVYSFRGDFQFYRTKLEHADPHHLRSTVYIENANHVHFNTDWGKRDLSLPRGAVLNTLDLIDAKEQQQIAKIYISAFLQTVLQKKDAFIPLFEADADMDSWLPETEIISKYRPATYKQLYAYPELPNADTYFANYKELTTYQASNRSGKNYPTRSLRLAWDESAYHKINFHFSELRNMADEQAEKLVLTVANDSENDEPITLITTLVVDDQEFSTDEWTLSPKIEIKSTLFGLFDDVFRDGKYEKRSDPIFENVSIPLIDLPEEDMEQIELHIEFSGQDGRILLEEVGLY